MYYIRYVIFWLLSWVPNYVVFGKGYRRARKVHKEYLKSLDKKKFLHTYSQSQLKRVSLLARKTPFYSSLSIGEDHTQWPLIDKDDVLNAEGRIIITKAHSDLISTGGTSGKPLVFYIDKSRKGFEWYWMTQGWSQVGFKLGASWRAVLRNHSLKGRDFVVNPFMREICFDNFRLDDEYLKIITREIKARKISFVHAYPSAAYTLAVFWKDNSCAPDCVKAFLCGSENVLEHQRDLIEERLGLRMMTWFGHSEKLILAHEGEVCQNYHANPLYGYMEIIDEDGHVITEAGEFGELVGTGYINTKTPFIRYRTGDYAEFVGDRCPECGFFGPTFTGVKGRWGGDQVYLKSNRTVTTTALNLHDEIYAKINGLQYFQTEKGILEVRIIPGIDWSKSVEKQLVESLSSKFMGDLEIIVKMVAELEFGKNRKYQLLIQKVKD